MRYCKDKHLTIANLQVVKDNEEKNYFEAIITIRIKGKHDTKRLLQSISTIDDVVSAEEI